MTTHEGWSNYATWCVNLWLSNEEPSYRQVTKMARRCIRQACDDLDVTLDPEEVDDDDGPGTLLPTPEQCEAVRTEATTMLADSIKDMCDDESIAPADLNGLALDLLRSALSDVDWHEIAMCWIQAEMK